jgi:glycine/D-amino acid oxidase-like deaminating enzyme
LYLSQSEAAQEKREAWLVNAKEHGLESYIVPGSGIGKYIHQSASEKNFWTGAIYTPSDAKAEPWQATPAIAELAHSEGVLIRENCAVRALDIQAGQITAVVTEAGRIKTSQVVLAGGAWSSLFLRRHGINIPQLSVRSSVARTVALDNVTMHSCADEGLAFRRRDDGGYTLAITDFEEHFIGPDSFRALTKWGKTAMKNWQSIKLSINQLKDSPDAWHTSRNWDENEVSPFEKMRVLDPAPTPGKTKLMQQSFAKRFPHIGEPELLNTWAGMIDSMPDLVPVVDRVPSLEGLIVATGMSGHGFGIAPAFGKIIAEIASGERSEHDLNRFRFSRFSDGSPLELGPGI